MARPKEPIYCHSDREHYCKGMCEPCYRKWETECLKNAIFALLGNRCANPGCRFLNEDGTFGCRDRRLLQIDHINGGGRKERKEYNAPRSYYRKILRDEGKGYRILCANCNWLHRHEEF